MKHIAIIGSGISGLTTAYLLSKKHKVTVFEKNEKVGGHHTGCRAVRYHRER